MAYFSLPLAKPGWSRGSVAEPAYDKNVKNAAGDAR